MANFQIRMFIDQPKATLDVKSFRRMTYLLVQAVSRLAPSLFRQSKKIGKGKIRKRESEVLFRGLLFDPDLLQMTKQTWGKSKQLAKCK